MSFIHHLHDRTDRRGFTLVELMVVLVLISILSAMLSYALASARQGARITRAQSEVRMIGQILQQKMNEISLSQVSLNYATPANGPSAVPAGVSESKERARLVMMARRDQLRMTLPTCRQDLIYPPTNLQFRQPGTGGWFANCGKIVVPGEWDRMRSLIGLRPAGEVDNAYQDSSGNSESPAQSAGQDAVLYYQSSNDFRSALRSTKSDVDVYTLWTRENESAECLYLILASTEIYGELAIDKIHGRSIGDTDGDGFNEIIDPWGNPYEFIRNPIGLESPVIKNYNPSGTTIAEQYPVDPDPLDFLLTDWRYDAAPDVSYFPIYLPPVVISAGPDGEYDLRRTYYENDAGELQGVNENYSTAVITWAADASMSPLYPNPSGSGSLPYRFPDPFYNVSAIPFAENTASPYPISASNLGQVNLAKAGQGLGGYTSNIESAINYDPNADDYDATADNISSLDGGF